MIAKGIDLLPPGVGHTLSSKRAKFLGVTVDILNVKQRKDEPLCNYVLRFTCKTLRLECSNDKLICLTFQNGLLIGPLYTELCQHPPTSSHDMWKFAHDFVAAEANTKQNVEQDTNGKRG